MKRAAVILSVAALLTIVALVAWWKLGGFYTVSVINIFNLQSRMVSGNDEDHLNKETFGGAAILGAAIRELKKSRPEALVTESGDLVMGPWWRLWRGEPEFTMAGLVGVEAGILGNHEFALGPTHLKEALSDFARFPILASNISFEDQGLTELVKKSVILTNSDGLKIGVFSLVPASLSTKIKIGEGITIDPDLEGIAARTVSQLKNEGAQVVILLTHASLRDNLSLAGKVEGIALIVSGDSDYSTETELRWVSGPGGWPTAVVGGGDNGRSLSAFTLTMHRGRPIPDMTAIKTVNLFSGLKPDPQVEALVAGFARRMDDTLNQTIGFFSTAVDTRRDYVRSRPAPIGNFLADAYRWKMGADIAVVNAGGIRGDRIFPAGPVTLAMVMEILPFQNHVLVKEMSGRDIRQMLEFSASALIGQDDDYKSAERISSSGFLHVSGLNVSLALSPVNRPLILDDKGEIAYPGNRVKFAGLLADGFISPLNDSEIYTVAMPDFLGQGGDKYNFIGELPTLKGLTLDFEAVVDYIVSKNKKPLSLRTDDRLTLERSLQ